MTTYDVITIGGGPAGLMAAGQAAARGARTLLLERMDAPGRKLRITGKGRCNLTNVAPREDFIAHFSPDGRFLYSAFSRFFTPDLLEFFEELGVKTVTERGGRVFPAAEDAQVVVQALIDWARRQGVELRTDARVRKLLLGEGRITGVRIAPDSSRIRARAVILATGGASYPATGSTGDGYRLAASAGHTITPIRPALVPLVTAGDTAARLQGLSLRNVNARLLVDGGVQAEAFGEMLFTHFGLSGPIILTLSRGAVDALAEKKRVAVSIDLKPALDEARLDARLRRDLDAQGRKQTHTLLQGLLPRKLIPVCLDLTGLPAEKPAHQVTAAERKRLLAWLKDFRLQVRGHRSFNQAIITAGGVSTREIDPRTMASRLVPGLFFAGEVIDLDADTGGYNLQAAFSTGWLAGRSAAGSALAADS